MLLALSALALAGAAADAGSRPFIDAAGLCYDYLVHRGASTAPIKAAGFTEAGKNATEQLFANPDGRTFIVLRQTDRFPVPECVAMTRAWESEVKAMVPLLEPVLGGAMDLGSMTTFRTKPTAIAAFLQSSTIQGAHFATLEMNRVDKEKSDQ